MYCGFSANYTGKSEKTGWQGWQPGNGKARQSRRQNSTQSTEHKDLAKDMQNVKETTWPAGCPRKERLTAESGAGGSSNNTSN